MTDINEVGRQVAELLKEAKEKNESALAKANDLLAQRQTKDTDVNKGGDTDAVTCKVCRDAISRSSGTGLPAWAKHETPAKHVLVVGECPTEKAV
jgi:hypothetical protein